MITELNVYTAMAIALVLLTFSIRLGVSLYKAS